MELNKETIDLAARHISDILSICFEHSDEKQKALVIYDQQCDLAKVITEAYRICLPNTKFIDFDQVDQNMILEEFKNLEPSDLVVLIQSTSFRLEKFRIRVSLFNKGMKVIEHPHLSRIPGEQGLYYIDALAYDPNYYRMIGNKLKERIDRAEIGIVKSGGEELVFNAGFEPSKLNVGDYSVLRNTGGQFPIGEVFTESKDLEAVSGRARIFAFGDTSYTVNIPEEPITLVIEKGRIVEVENSTPEFDRVLENIRKDEGGEVWVRELGFGMNRALGRERVISDIGTFERMCGIHLSIGAKHNAFKKPGAIFVEKTAKHHVDIFTDTQAVLLDGVNIYQNDEWCPQ